MFFACENPYVRELLRRPVYLESVRVTTDLWQNGQPPCALSPEFRQSVTRYEVIVPYDTKEIHFRGSPLRRASVSYAAADGSPALRTGVFSYDGIYEPRVFTVTAWEQYMDDTVYVFTVKRELNTSALQDLRVWYDLSTNNSDIVDDKNYLTETFAKNYTGYHANINAEANAVIALVLPAGDGTQTYAYTDESGTYDPAISGWIGTETIGGTPYQRIRIPFLKTQHNNGTLSVTTAQPGMSPTTYTLQLIREKTVAKLAALTVTPQGPAGTAWALDGDPLAGGFDPGSQNYGGEFTKETTGVKIEAQLDSFAPEGSTITYEIVSPSGIAFSTLNEGTKRVMSFASPLNKFVVSITITSGNTATHDHNLYTVAVTREGVFQIVKDPDVDAELKVRVQNAGGFEAATAQVGTPLTLTVTNNLGYTVSGVTVDVNGGAGPDSNLIAGLLPNGVIVTNTLTEFKYTFTMPNQNLVFRAAHASIPSVDKVAYVAQEGRNSAGYDSAARTADSWGTASTDLQKVINSWNGSNFDEIWIMGTVTPKSRANINIAGYSASIPTSEVPDNNPTVTQKKNLAFVIPPGLRLYGGFRGTETASGTIKSGAANDTRDKTINDSEDWRQRTVLSGSLDSLNKVYHVVLMADIPYTSPDTNPANTILDGLTVTGGMGATSSGTISFRSYSDTSGIKKQSGAGMYLQNASPVLTNLRIQDNRATVNELADTAGGGGGIYNFAYGGGVSSPRLSDTVISDNLVQGAGSGGAMYNMAWTSGSNCSPVLNRVTIERNQTGKFAGGIFNMSNHNSAVCEPLFTNTVIAGNVSTMGGGVLNHGTSKPRFEAVVIRVNSASNGLGGGVYNFVNSSPVFENVTLAGNFAIDGGGVYNESFYLTMTNVSISGNVVLHNGGGIYNCGGAVLTNIRIEKNNAGWGSGGGLCNNLTSVHTDKRSALIITNGSIRNNYGGTGGGISSIYEYSGADDYIAHLTLTNVLIANNKATTGGGIFNGNTLGPNITKPGKGIVVWLNNVTIAGNEAANHNGMYTTPANLTGTVSNHVKVRANNCIIWNDIYNPTSDRLELNNTLAQSYSGSILFSGSSPFAGPGGSTAPDSDYAIAAGAVQLINTGGAFPGSVTDLLPAGTLPLPLSVPRQTVFNTLMEDTVLSGSYPNRLIDKDATAALGDRLHTAIIPGTGYILDMNLSLVTVTDTPPAAAGADRPRNVGAIDLGAFETQQ